MDHGQSSKGVSGERRGDRRVATNLETNSMADSGGKITPPVSKAVNESRKSWAPSTDKDVSVLRFELLHAEDERHGDREEEWLIMIQ